jgi:hypothetical protein
MKLALPDLTTDATLRLSLNRSFRPAFTLAFTLALPLLGAPLASCRSAPPVQPSPPPVTSPDAGAVTPAATVSSGSATGALDALAGAGRPVRLDAGIHPVEPTSSPALPTVTDTVAFAVEGCLADKGAAAKSAPAAPAARALPTHPPEQVDLKVVSGGLRLTHQLSHACCLEAQVTTSVRGAQVSVVEELKGTPCRCKCDSTVHSAVALKPGEYNVRLVVRQPGREREVRRAQVTVP